MGGDKQQSRLKRRPKRKGNHHTRNNDKKTEVVADDGEMPGPSQPKLKTISYSK